MIIREANSNDLPEIVTLLKSSLGDRSSEKSIEYWKWKHIDNPFGVSPVLVAEENNALIGVRAMMQWRWIEGKKIYKALRAVDTATHPSHQGKGIFKKLTLQLIEQAKKEEFDFVFNTPNKVSIIGYLKMGWIEWGRIPVLMRPILSCKSFKSELFESFHQDLMKSEFSDFPTVCSSGNGLHTLITFDWLKWRYQLCPAKKYIYSKSAVNSNRLWLFASVKMHSWGAELRICNFLFSEKFSSGQLFKQANKWASELGCKAVTLAGLQQINMIQYLRYGYFPITRLSLKFTLRALSQPLLITNFIHKDNWFLNSGDIELF
jgi:GNAT superfamily N-acetyltransferase